MKKKLVVAATMENFTIHLWPAQLWRLQKILLFLSLFMLNASKVAISDGNILSTTMGAIVGASFSGNGTISLVIITLCSNHEGTSPGSDPLKMACWNFSDNSSSMKFTTGNISVLAGAKVLCGIFLCWDIASSSSSSQTASPLAASGIFLSAIATGKVDADSFHCGVEEGNRSVIFCWGNQFGDGEFLPYISLIPSSICSAATANDSQGIKPWRRLAKAADPLVSSNSRQPWSSPSALSRSRQQASLSHGSPASSSSGPSQAYDSSNLTASSSSGLQKSSASASFLQPQPPYLVSSGQKQFFLSSSPPALSSSAQTEAPDSLSSGQTKYPADSISDPPQCPPSSLSVIMQPLASSISVQPQPPVSSISGKTHPRAYSRSLLILNFPPEATTPSLLPRLSAAKRHRENLRQGLIIIAPMVIALTAGGLVLLIRLICLEFCGRHKSLSGKGRRLKGRGLIDVVAEAPEAATRAAA